jgi:hypothetical protein
MSWLSARRAKREARASIPIARTPHEVERIRRLQARSAIYKILIAYFAVVCLNAASVIALIWLQAFNTIQLPESILGALALGTGGLGAGSLVFSTPIKQLFAPEPN